MPGRDRYLTYSEVADLLEAELGTRPALSTLRAAAADNARGVLRTRLTAGLPAPHDQRDDSGRTVFAAAEIHRWIEHHPRRQIRREQERLIAAPSDRRPQAVQKARQAGLSWQQIAAAFAEADGTTYTRQWAQQRFR